MNPFENYVRQVEECGDQRGNDMNAELLADLYAELEIRRKSSALSDENLMSEILKSRQDAAALAAALENPRFLIGPKVYPAYRIALTYSLVAIVITVAAMGLAAGTAWSTISDVAISVAVGIGIITGCFALLERAGWIQSQDRRVVASIQRRSRPHDFLAQPAYALTLLLAINLWPGLLALPVVEVHPLRIVMLSVVSASALAANAAAINAWALGVLFAHAVRLSPRVSWEQWRGVRVALGVSGLAVAVWTLRGGDLFRIDEAALNQVAPEMAAAIASVAPQLDSAFLMVAWGGVLWSAACLGRDLWNLARKSNLRRAS